MKRLFATCLLLTALPVMPHEHDSEDYSEEMPPDSEHIDDLARRTLFIRNTFKLHPDITTPFMPTIELMLTRFTAPDLSLQGVKALELHVRRFEKLAKACAELLEDPYEAQCIATMLLQRAALVHELNQLRNTYLFTYVVGNNLPAILQRPLTRAEHLSFSSEQDALMAKHKAEFYKKTKRLTALEEYLLSDDRSLWEKYETLIKYGVIGIGGLALVGLMANAAHDRWTKNSPPPAD